MEHTADDNSQEGEALVSTHKSIEDNPCSTADSHSTE